jgi:glutamate dehydrogenase (NADP+)
VDCKEIFETFYTGLERRNPNEPEFLQAVHEVAHDVIPFIADNPRYQDRLLLERMTEPDRIISFRVCWVDDQGNIRANRGYRVQNNNAIGPYKGGIRFHPTVNLSILKFLAFEQTFKNSLTGLSMGGAKGGSDFNPRGKSEGEVMRFCQSFMTELWRYIGPDTDIPAGDIGVGSREIGYMFGQFKRLTNSFTGTITGKGLEFGGSLIRAEATGYGTVYMLEAALKDVNDTLEGKHILISGSGNVALYAAEKAIQHGAVVNTLSDSDGYIYDPNGFNAEKLAYLKKLKLKDRGRINQYLQEFEAEFHADQKPWKVPCDIALPCATQNEISGDDARVLVSNGCRYVVEGANMPSTPEAVAVFQNSNTVYVPGKAANAGGVAVSGLEMSQNASKISWDEKDLQMRLHNIMHSVHEKCAHFGREGDRINYQKGANIGGFIKVAEAMLAYGVV